MVIRRMSVSDPLIRNIKASALLLVQESDSKKIKNSSPNLKRFCETLETIYHKGFVQTTTYYFKKIEVFDCLSNLSSTHNLLDNPDNTTNYNFSYQNCVFTAKNNRSLTSLGKFRLLIRLCLANKCLHVPLELMMQSNCCSKFYEKNSIVGDEILAAILLSVLKQCGKLNFALERVLENSCFLDSCWDIPETVKLELVPCKALGIAVSFSDNKAVIVHVQPDSVASDTGEIFRGDVLVNLNGSLIDSSKKGRLNTILHSQIKRPVQIVVAKALVTADGSNKIIPYPPIRKLLENLQIDVEEIVNRRQSHDEVKTVPRSGGYRATYLGRVNVGSKGSVKEIEEGLKHFLRPRASGGDFVVAKEEIGVRLEIGEITVRVLREDDVREEVMTHSFMEISSCGSASGSPHHIAYISGNANGESSEEFTCHVFYVANLEAAANILKCIGQGFHRTHFAV